MLNMFIRLYILCVQGEPPPDEEKDSDSDVGE